MPRRTRPTAPTRCSSSRTATRATATCSARWRRTWPARAMWSRPSTTPTAPMATRPPLPAPCSTARWTSSSCSARWTGSTPARPATRPGASSRAWSTPSAPGSSAIRWAAMAWSTPLAAASRPRRSSSRWRPSTAPWPAARPASRTTSPPATRASRPPSPSPPGAGTPVCGTRQGWPASPRRCSSWRAAWTMSPAIHPACATCLKAR